MRRPEVTRGSTEYQDEEEDDDDGGTRRSLADRAREKLLHTLPAFSSIDQEDLERVGAAWSLAVAHLLVYGGLLLYFTCTGTVTEMSRKFLSLDAPSVNDAVCRTVPVAVTGTFQADTQGFWSSHATFNPKLPIYEVEMTGSTVDLPGYSAAMANFSAQLQASGARSASYDVLSSIILWNAFRAVPDSQAHIQMRTYADVKESFSKMQLVHAASSPTLASRQGVCRAMGISATYDPLTMLITTKFPYTAPVTASPTQQPTKSRSPTSLPTASRSDDSYPPPYEPCPDQLTIFADLSPMGIRLSGFSADLDLRTALTAFAVNFGVIEVSALTAVSDVRVGAAEGFASPGRKVSYVSGSFPGMQPIECLLFSSKPTVCLAISGSYASFTFSYIYPVLSTSKFGSQGSRGPGAACACPGDASDYWCNNGRYSQLSLVFSKTGLDSDTVALAQSMQKTMLDSPVDGTGQVRQMLANLGYTSQFVKEQFDDSDYQAWLLGQVIDRSTKKPFPLQSYKDFKGQFARMPDGMSLMTFPLDLHWGYALRFNTQGVTLSSFSTGLVNASTPSAAGSASASALPPVPLVMCRDTLFQPAALAAMTAAPPVAIVQPYLSCSSTLRAAFINAVGIANGNASLSTSVFLALSVLLVVMWHNNAKNKKSKGWFKLLAPGRKAAIHRAAAARDKRAQHKENARLEQQLSAVLRHAHLLSDVLAKHGIANLPPLPQHAQQYHSPLSPHLPLPKEPDRISMRQPTPTPTPNPTHTPTPTSAFSLTQNPATTPASAPILPTLYTQHTQNTQHAQPSTALQHPHNSPAISLPPGVDAHGEGDRRHEREMQYDNPMHFPDSTDFTVQHAGVGPGLGAGAGAGAGAWGSGRASGGRISGHGSGGVNGYASTVGAGGPSRLSHGRDGGL